MRRAMMLGLALAAGPAAAGVLSEAEGNWAGSSAQGFAFRAELSDDAGAARLRIWQGLPETPPALEFDQTGLIARDNIIAGGRQELRLEVQPGGTTLVLHTEAADESGEMTEDVSVRFVDFQFTVTAYRIALTGAPDAPDYHCAVDLAHDEVTFQGLRAPLAPRPAEADNLALWQPRAAFDRGFCPPPG